ncbi:MAG: DUF4402 domain-containing protein [Alphaproteobacteria bacterium]|nr:DUF4402 domain-containing protein [Alphaproteobacteria bacterium]
MKYVSLFTLGLILSTSAFAATGTGHAQAELSNPLSVTNDINVDFGTIAIDPAAGPQTISMSNTNVVSCPTTYICSGAPTKGALEVTGAPTTNFQVNLVGSTATLSDGTGNTILFDPTLGNSSESGQFTMAADGTRNVSIIGELSFTGNEPAGTYNTTNPGGSGYTVTVNY